MTFKWIIFRTDICTSISVGIGNRTHCKKSDLSCLQKLDRKLNIKIFHYSILSLDINVRWGCNYKRALNQVKIIFPYWTKENPNKLHRHLPIWLPQLVFLFWKLSPISSSSCSSCFPLLLPPTSGCSRNAIHRAVILPAAKSICFHP